MRKQLIMTVPAGPALLVSAAVLLAVGLLVGSAAATETEHLGMRVLPTPGEVTVDGKADDWDLTGGIFACGHIERQRDQFSCWFHTMYDARNLHMLVRWIDRTPMNNPHSVVSDTGFRGDCLQVRFIMPGGRTLHVTAWACGKDKKHRVDISYGKLFNEGHIRDAQQRGARQAFLKNADGKGYSQEISLPWKLVTKGGAPLKPGAKFSMTLEPNFTVGGSGRLSIKDIFKPGVEINRYSTFNNPQCWGTAVMEPKGNVKPWPVRLSGGRQYAVKMQGDLPVVNWGGGFPNAPAPVVQTPKDPPKQQPPPTPVAVVKPQPPALSPRLTIRSAPITAVSIRGDKPGNTPYTVMCSRGEEVVLLAPAYPPAADKRYAFVRWVVDGTAKTQGLIKATVSMKADQTALAVYEVKPLPETEDTPAETEQVVPDENAAEDIRADAADDSEAVAGTQAIAAAAAPSTPAETFDRILTAARQNVIIAVLGAVMLGFLVGRISVPRPRA